MPASGEAISMPSASGISLMPGVIGLVALCALEVEHEQEHQREAREPVDERGRARGGEQAVAEQPQVEHRRARAALDQHPQRQQHRGQRQAAIDDGVVPAGRAPRARRPAPGR